MDPIAALERATQTYEQRLAAVGPDEWHLPSTCDGWTVRDLADHVVGGNRYAVALLAGASAEDAFVRAVEAGFDTDALTLTRESAARQLDAFRARDSMTTTVHHPSGDIDGATLLGFRVGDLVLHGWDLARSTGGDEHMDDELVAFVWDAYAPRRAALVAGGGFGTGSTGQLASSAPLAARLLDLTGRRTN